MEPCPSSCERTAWSISALDIVSCEMRLEVYRGLPTTDGGKSHSCVTPTRLSSSPSAQTISVADGRSETMRGRVPILETLPVCCLFDCREVGARAARLSRKARLHFCAAR